MLVTFQCNLVNKTEHNLVQSFSCNGSPCHLYNVCTLLSVEEIKREVSCAPEPRTLTAPGHLWTSSYISLLNFQFAGSLTFISPSIPHTPLPHIVSVNLHLCDRVEMTNFHFPTPLTLSLSPSTDMSGIARLMSRQVEGLISKLSCCGGKAGADIRLSVLASHLPGWTWCSPTHKLWFKAASMSNVFHPSGLKSQKCQLRNKENCF